MARPKKVKKESPTIYLTAAQIRETKGEIKELELMLEQDAQRQTPKISDHSEIKAEILKKTQYLERHSPHQLHGDAANKAYKEAKELEKLIKEGMPKSSAFYQRYPKGSDSHLKQQKFEEAVKQQMKFQTDKRLKEAVFKYKSIMSRLDPQDPTVRNIERLRSGR